MIKYAEANQKKRVGKKYVSNIYENEDAQNEIIRKTGIGEMPVHDVELDQWVDFYSDKEPIFEIGTNYSYEE